VTSCGDKGGTSPGGSTTTTVLPTTTIAALTTTIEATTTTAEPTTTTTTVVGLEQPAIWPAAGAVFETPEEAAADFVTQVLGVEPALGQFQQGDSRSGEIQVFSPGEGTTATAVARGMLLLRQLGPRSGWFVIAATNALASITSPVSAAAVAAGPLTVEGVATGFEASIVVSALVAGNSKSVLDSQITQGGNMGVALPYSVALDLSGAAPGAVVMLLVRGGAGLETDPGEFGAIPIVIGG
jgi:hypothetical protein